MSKPAKEPGRPAASANGATHKAAGGVPAAHGNPAEVALAVKALVRWHGADVIKQMVDVFAD